MINPAMTTSDLTPHTQKLDLWVKWLLIFMAAGAFLLSYFAMYALAAEKGIEWFLVWLWPMVTEAGVVIFSLALLRARLHGYDSKSLYWLVIVCAGLSVFFNVSHAPQSDFLGRAVFALPPIFLLLAFKTLLWQIEQDSKRTELIITLQALQSQRNTLNAEADKLKQQIEQQQIKLNQLKQATKQEKMSNLGSLTDANAIRFANKQAALDALLNYLRHNPEASFAQAGQAIGRSKSTISNYVDELINAGQLSKNGHGWAVIG